MRKVYLALLLIVSGLLFTVESYAQLVITYTPVTSSCAGSNVTLSGVNITDPTGIPLAGGTIPRIYYRRNTGLWNSVAGVNTGGTATNSDWTFTMDASLAGGFLSGDVVTYYVIAQNTGGTVVSQPSAGLVAADVNTVTTPPSSPNSLNVIALPSAITGANSVCEGASTNFNSTPAGGAWSSSDVAVATVSATGSVTGILNGTAEITYTAATGCIRTKVITVNPLPAAITPATGTVCSGQTLAMSNITPLGTWSSSSTPIANINTPSGVITGGSSAGTARITYTLGTGCRSVTIVTNNLTPAAINGTASVCEGLTTTLTDATAGGAWSSSDVAVASITSGTGFVTGVGFGTATISYTGLNGCVRTRVATVYPTPAAIVGASDVCATFSTTLTNITPGGTWSSSTSGIANIGVTTGVVNAVTAGTTTITYKTLNGCINTLVMTVNALPAAITGTATVCENSITAFNSLSVGGLWASSNPANATVDATGIITGILAGTSDITYTLPTGCYRTRVVTVNPVPAAIAGTLVVCPGTTSALTNATAAGTWSSGTTTVATINSGSGMLMGIAAGTSLVSYRLSTGCMSVSEVTVNPLPAAITGVSNVCVGGTTDLDNTDVGGIWTSGNGLVASVDGTGLVSGLAAGTSWISYTMPTTCSSRMLVTVNVTPTAITGTLVVCEGSTTNLMSTPGAGTWSSSDLSVASAALTTGVITGVGAGTATIFYSVGGSGGCINATVVTVNPLPQPITGVLSVCIGSTTVLSNISTGGTWTSGNPSRATISTDGTVTGLAAGTTTISYTLPSGCARVVVVTVNTLPTSITGTAVVCEGSNTTLNSSPTGGTWSSADVTIATISPARIVTGVAAGTTNISYILPTGCYRTLVVTVNALPDTIVGPGIVCSGRTITLTNATAGGTWSTVNTAYANVGAATGIVTGGSNPGTATISYTLSSGCRVTTVVTNNLSPNSTINGANVFCQGNSVTYTNTTSGGVWSSSDATVANISGATGFTSGVNPGTAMITYTIVNGCYSLKQVTVNPIPAPISGSLEVCVGAASTLSNTSPGGTWASGNISIATVNNLTGVATGVLGGTVVVTYKLSNSCLNTAVLTVNALPVISGTATVCHGSTVTLSSTTIGGVWTSGNLAVATVDAGGAVTGIAPGTSIIYYAAPGTGCTATRTITVNPLPAAIAGAGTVCPGATTALTNLTSGGTWSTADAFTATVSTSGIVTGVALGVTDITYKLVTTCFVTKSMTVNSIPTPITGAATVCAAGGTTILSNASAGGTWSSSNMSAATVDATGIVTGIAAGSTTISYALSSGCRATMVVTVQPVPTVISGLTTVCSGLTTALTSSPAGGVWASDAPSVANVSAFGVVNGLTAGTAGITYALGTGCNRSVIVTVNPTPPPATGSTSVCLGTTGTLLNALPGGLWTSGSTTVATVSLPTGIVTPVNAGNVNITYTMPTGCKSVTNITINSLPANITGTAAVCVNLSTLLTSSTAGGEWTSSAPGTASVGSGSGVVVGIIPGTATISYTLTSNGCANTRIVTVHPLPAAITGTGTVCEGGTTTLATVTPGGTWSSGSTANATIGVTSGVVTGVANGTSTITYRMGTGCLTTTEVTVLPVPAPITGVTNVCVGGTTTFISTTLGGTWSSSNPFVALVGTNGVVTGNSAGTSVISYVMGSGCFAIKMVSVSPMPSAISGTLMFCQGSNSSLSSLTPGGSWTSSNTLVATIGITNGLVSGLTDGLSTIVYTAPSGCIATAQVTVNPLPNAITGDANICVGTTSDLDNLSLGGTWSSGNPIRATIDGTTGVVTGVSAGTAAITYMMPTGCRTTTIVTISSNPATILGVNNVCVGNTVTLTNTTSGGTWTSEDETIATISVSGVVTGITPGTSVISYTLASGCSRTVTMNVLDLPSPITGSGSVCIGSSSLLESVTTGGVWTSSIPSRATVHVSTGLLTGVNAGTSIITYSLSGCQVYLVATVHPLPAAIAGITNICTGATTTLTNAVSGGVWSNVDASITTVEPSTGVVTGVGAGTDTVRYTLTGGCSTYKIVTVTATPAPITGDFEICVGESSALVTTPTGGSWSSADPSIAAIGLSSGIVSGVSAGLTSVTYSVGAGCSVSVPIQVNGMPTPITGPAEVCTGDSVTLFNTVAGGTWTTGDITIASVNDITGVVTGNAAGTVTINYELPGGCSVGFSVTVNPAPLPITGVDSVCQGLTTDLDNATPGTGIWTSSAPSIAPINLTTGVVTGVAIGTSNITYTLLGTGCKAVRTVSVNPGASPIGGSTFVCVGSFTTLSNSTPGGTWSSSDLTKALIGSTTGLVTGVAAGSSVVTYLLPTGCLSTAIVVVNPLPGSITGTLAVCSGSTGVVTNPTPFGTWSSSDATVATIGSTTGVITGVNSGTSTITYTLLATGCYETQQVTINPVPPAITGLAEICLGTSTVLGNPVSGGSWSSSNPAVASIDAFGNATATGVGTSTITYTIGASCYQTRLVTVEPTLNPITGVSNVCELASITLANDFVGGVWSSSNVAVATVGSSTGVVTGVTAGPVTISYATPLAGCYALAALTVDPIPVAITGTDSVCVGATTALSDATPGGTWSSSDATIASVNATGVVTGVSANTATITYTIGAGCITTLNVKVKALSNAGSISGPASVCFGQVVTLVDAAPGGVWSSSNASVASVSATGAVTGVAVGTAVISYIVTNDCDADTATFSILVKPEPDAGTLSGTTGLCINYVSTLATTISGGTWSSSNSAVAAVTSAGVVTGMSAGTATISYGVTTDCGIDYATIVITVYTMAPKIAIKIHPDTVLCANTLFRNFSAEFPASAGNTYTWTVDNGEVYATSAGDKQNAIISFHGAGTATVRLITQITSTGCFATDSFVARIKTDSAFSPEVKYFANEFICTDNTSDSYQWGYDDATSLDSTMIYGAYQQSYYMPVPDFTNRRYWVIAERGGCFQKVYYNPPTEIDPAMTGAIDIRLFPNPADSRINIEVKGISKSDEISIRLIDMLGKELEAAELVNGKGSINVANLPSGIYSVMFINNGIKVAGRTFVKN